jgi:hypothetical protein
LEQENATQAMVQTILRGYDALGNPAEYQINKRFKPGNTSSLLPSFTLVGNRKK